MTSESQFDAERPTTDGSRRRFLGGAAALAASGSLWKLAATAAEPAAAESTPKSYARKIKVGIVGCGGRGTLMANLFRGHGGYEVVALTDYFSENSERVGAAIGLDAARCFSGLDGYRRIIDVGVEALVLQSLPCFFPAQAEAAVAAGLHVYMAKPVAVDVPGCLKIAAAGTKATERRRVFLVDYQLPTEPINVEIAERVRRGELGPLAKIATVGVSGGHADPPKTATIESRLQKHIWDNDIELGGGHLNCFDIHAVDAARWVLGRRPTAAVAMARVCRDDPHGDAHDACSIVYEYDDGLIHEHSGQNLPNAMTGILDCTIVGRTGHAVVSYFGQAKFQVRGQKAITGDVVKLYVPGAERNIATFYEAVTNDRYENETVPRAVDGCLTCILGREASVRGRRLTMDELIRENKPLEVDLTGLKV